MSIIDKAIAMAVKAHKGQVDKAGRPYILHCLRVAFKFIGDEEMFTAAVLHDAVEDSDVTIEQIRKAFGSSVARVVDSLTRREGEEYLTQFIPRCKLDGTATVIKIADIKDNLDPERIISIKNYDQKLYSRYLEALKQLREY